MGVGLTNYMENNILNWIFKSGPFAAVPTVLYYGLHSADPGDTGATELGATGSYARAQLNPDSVGTNVRYNAAATGSPSTSQKITNISDIVFPQASADWNGAAAIQFYTCFDAITTGNAIFTGAIAGGGVVVLNGNTLRLIGGSPGAMSFQLD